MAAANLTVRPESDLSVSLAAICSYWKEFDLDSRRIKLDEVGSTQGQHLGSVVGCLH